MQKIIKLNKESYSEELVEHDFHDIDVISEEFPLEVTGNWNWDYTHVNDKINYIYQLGKQQAWDVEKDIDWTSETKAYNEDSSPFGIPTQHRFINYKPFLKLSTVKRKQFLHDVDGFVVSQLLHGEQGAFLVASQLCSTLPTLNSRLYASSQTFDEARHVEAFTKYLSVRHKGVIWPFNSNYKDIITRTLQDERWDIKFVCMQGIIEYYATSVFNTLRQNTADTMFADMLKLIIRDETRHVAFGRNFLTDYYKTLDDKELDSRAIFLADCLIKLLDDDYLYHGHLLYEKYNFDPEETIKHVKDFDNFIIENKRKKFSGIDFDPTIDHLETFQMTDRFTLMVKSVAVFNDLQLIRPCNIPMLEDAFELNISEILQ